MFLPQNQNEKTLENAMFSRVLMVRETGLEPAPTKRRLEPESQTRFGIFANLEPLKHKAFEGAR